jgi:hypothetical protein
MILIMSATGMVGRASVRIRRAHLEHVFIYVIEVRVMQVAVMQVVGMIGVGDRHMTTGRAMLMCVILMCRAGHSGSPEMKAAQRRVLSRKRCQSGGPEIGVPVVPCVAWGGRRMERVKGIEPSSLGWEPRALPLSYTRRERLPRRRTHARNGIIHRLPAIGQSRAIHRWASIHISRRQIPRQSSARRRAGRPHAALAASILARRTRRTRGALDLAAI